ncbi:MAG TPA: hypothetical protein VGI99_12740 [Gemmataceae bacterium]
MASRGKTAKPYKDFPFFLHSTGQWAKKISGKMHFFGVDVEAAADRHSREKEALYAGHKPGPAPGAVTVRDLTKPAPTMGVAA